MPRSGSGTYTLPSGNPVVTGTTIESNWANTTLSDIATTLSDSLSRSGQGGMTAALRVADGTQGAPGVGFANETGSGFYRAGTGEVWAVVQGAQTLNLDANGVTVPSDKATSIEGTFVFNETGADKDARFEGDTDANLLFVDASTDRVGVGTNTPAAKLDVNGTAAISGNVTLSGGTANGVLYLDGSKVATSGSALTFDGTNLGIGTSSPSAKLDIGGTNNTVFFKNSGATTGYALATVSNTGGAFQYGISSSTGTFWGAGNAGNYSANIGTTTATNLGFGTGDTLRMTLDSSGNLGLGVTPSAWVGKAIEIGPAANGFLFNDSNNVNLGANAYYNAGWKYQTSSVGASRYAQSSGGHSWFTAPSGTAGNAISFTQAMTLDASGNLSIGATSPPANERLYVTGAINSGAIARIANTNNAAYSTTAYAPLATLLINNPSTTASTAAGITFITTGSGLGSAASIGAVATNASGYGNALVFQTRDTAGADGERARITSGGDLLVGNTSGSGRLYVKSAGSTNATYITYLENSSATRCFAIESAGRIYTGTAAESPYNFTTASAANLFVASDGTLYRSTSSLKYKTDVQDATHGLAEVMQLRPVTYKGKTDGDTVFGGLIAEEVHAAGLTEFVQYAEDGSPDALAYGNMVSVLVKAIQEQQALITALIARVAALEAKP